MWCLEKYTMNTKVWAGDEGRYGEIVYWER